MAVDMTPPPAVVELTKNIKDKHTIRYEADWKGYKVFLLSYPEYEIGESGLPIFILYKDNKARVATDEETTLEIMPEIY